MPIIEGAQYFAPVTYTITVFISPGEDFIVEGRDDDGHRATAEGMNRLLCIRTVCEALDEQSHRMGRR